MPGPHPVAMREKVVKTYLKGKLSYRQVGERFGIGEATVSRWVSLHRRTGSVKPKEMGGSRRPRAISPDQESFIAQVLIDVPDASGPEITKWLVEEYGKTVSTSSVVKTLHRMGYTRRYGNPKSEHEPDRMLWRKPRVRKSSK